MMKHYHAFLDSRYPDHLHLEDWMNTSPEKKVLACLERIGACLGKYGYSSGVVYISANARSDFKKSLNELIEAKIEIALEKR